MSMVDSMDNPLASLTHKITSARAALFNEPLGVEAQVDDPLEALEHRIASGVRAARFAPPLTGLVADIEAAAHIRDHAMELVDLTEFDLIEKLAPSKPVAPSPSPPRAVMLTPAKKTSSPKSPGVDRPGKSKAVSPPVTRPEQGVQRASGGGVIADVLLDAIATRDLPGAARAEAARLLSQGLALGDEGLMQEALATLITGV